GFAPCADLLVCAKNLLLWPNRPTSKSLRCSSQSWLSGQGAASLPVCHQSEPLSDPGMIPRCSRKEIGFARLAAEAEAPMLVVVEPELSATIYAAMLKVAHKTLHCFGGGLHLAGTRLSFSFDPQTGLVTLG